MDQTTIALLNAIEFMFRESCCGLNRELLDVYRFEEESEVHLVLTEAVEGAKLSLGMDHALDERKYAQAL